MQTTHNELIGMIESNYVNSGNTVAIMASSGSIIFAGTIPSDELKDWLTVLCRNSDGMRSIVEQALEESSWSVS